MTKNTKYIVKPSEITLKGKNRHIFENTLINNIRNQIKKRNGNAKITKEHTRIIITTNTEKKTEDALKHTFGISKWYKAKETKKEITEIIKTSLKETKKEKNKTIQIKVKRADKTFPLTSIETAKKIGEELTKNGYKINLKNGKTKLKIEITQKAAYITTKEKEGLKGLPTGTSGKTLMLISGGIDSPTAAWLAMKRGCKIEYLHVHAYATNKDAEEKSKVIQLIKTLTKYQPTTKIHLLEYTHYALSIKNTHQKYETLLFKHYLYLLANELTKKHKYEAIITGDSIGQVASQTLPNMRATQTNITPPIIQPLITYDKEEITNLAKKIGTYEISIKPEKDCCSITAKKPITKGKTEILQKLIKENQLKEKTKEHIKKIHTIKI